MTADRGTRWGALGLLALTVAGAAAMRNVFSPVQDMAKADLGLSDVALSLVQGLAAALPVALLSLPIGRLIDRSSRVRLLVLMAIAWTAGMALTVVAGGFVLLFIARMLTGLGYFCVIPVAISLVADFSAPDHRGRAMILISIGNIVGGAAAFGLGGALFGVLSPGGFAGLVPWRAVQLVFTLASLGLFLPLLLLREPARHELGAAAGAPFGAALAELWTRRGLLIPLFIGQVSVVMADVACLFGAPSVLGRDYHQSPDQFGGWLGLIILLSGLLGAVIGGLAADRGQKSARPNGILLGAVATASLSILGGLFPLMPTTLGFGLLAGLLLLSGTATGLITSAALTVLIPNEIRGICLGAFVVVAAIVALGLAPTLVSWISNLLGGESQLRYGLAITTVATSLAATIGFALALREGPPTRC